MYERNRRVFEGKVKETDNIVADIQENLNDWSRGNVMFNGVTRSVHNIIVGGMFSWYEWVQCNFEWLSSTLC